MEKIVLHYFFKLSLIFTCCINLTVVSAETQDIVVGAERPAEYLSLLKNKRVGVLVNPTSRVGNNHLVDSLLTAKVNIELIFAPEHGFRGQHGAGEQVIDNRDSRTGIEIISLHGKIKKPTAEHLSRLDVIIFDIQDVGVRYYTYISSMHYLMEACADSKVPLIIFDRPNPNGDYIDGPIMEDALKSFIGMHSIPIVHGMTVAELALMINGEGWLGKNSKGELKKCDLLVIKNKNYDHNKRYSLPVKPSPNLPNDLSIRLYPSLGFFESTQVSIGRGTPWPFQVLGYTDKTMGSFSFKPEKIRGSWSELNHAEISLYGEKLKRDYMATGIDLQYIKNWYEKFKMLDKTFFVRERFMDKLSGSSSLRTMIENGRSIEAIKSSWRNDLIKFQQTREKYLLYPDSRLIIKIFQADNSFR